MKAYPKLLIAATSLSPICSSQATITFTWDDLPTGSADGFPSPGSALTPDGTINTDFLAYRGDFVSANLGSGKGATDGSTGSLNYMVGSFTVTATAPHRGGGANVVHDSGDAGLGV